MRLGGAEHLELFNLERSFDELKRLVTEKQRAQEQVLEQDQEEEQVVDQEAEQEKTRKRKREMVERTERKVSKPLSVGSLRLMHKDGKTNFKSPIVQQRCAQRILKVCHSERWFLCHGQRGRPERGNGGSVGPTANVCNHRDPKCFRQGRQTHSN